VIQTAWAGNLPILQLGEVFVLTLVIRLESFTRQQHVKRVTERLVRLWPRGSISEDDVGQFSGFDSELRSFAFEEAVFGYHVDV
jgi:hypothetical protein